MIKEYSLWRCQTMILLIQNIIRLFGPRMMCLDTGFNFNKKGILQTVQKHGFKHLSTKPMILDSIYVSILSEKYKGTRMYYLFGFFIGVLSNLLAMFSKEYSSNIFIFEKTN